LVQEARERAQLGLAADRLMKAQIVSDLRHHGVAEKRSQIAASLSAAASIKLGLSLGSRSVASQ
jgi:hypothetical protein